MLHTHFMFYSSLTVRLHAQRYFVVVDVLEERSEVSTAIEGQLEGQLGAHIGEQCSGGHTGRHHIRHGLAVKSRGVFLLDGHVVPHTERPLEVEGRSAAPQLAVTHDGNSVSEQVSFVHEVCRQYHHSAKQNMMPRHVMSCSAGKSKISEFMKRMSSVVQSNTT